MIPRKSRRKAAVWGLMFSYSSIVYAIISGIALVPLYLRHIPLDLYGAWLATGNVLVWLTVVDPGIASVITQRAGVAYGKKDNLALMGYTTAGLLITLGICVFIVGTGWGISFYLPDWVNLSNESTSIILRKAFLMAISGTAIMILSYALSAVNYGMLGSLGPGIVGVISSFGSLIVIAVLIFADYGLYAIAAGFLFRGSGLLLGNSGYLLWRLHKEGIKPAFSISKFGEVLSLLSFTSIGKVGTTFSSHMDAFLISRFIGPETVAVYVLTKRSFNIGETLLNRTGQAVGVGISHLSGEGDYVKIRSVIRRLIKLNIWMLGLAFGGFLSLNKTFVSLWVGEEFFAGTLISSLLCFYLVSRVMLTVMSSLCVSLGDIKRSSVVIFTYSILVFAILLAGIYYLGILGAIIAPLVGYSVVYFWYYPKSLSKRARLIKSDWIEFGIEVIKAATCAILLSFFFFFYQPAQWLLFGLAAGTYALSYGLLICSVSKEARVEFSSLLTVIAAKVREIKHARAR
ncbi:oligosaccharide flippase family protein [Puniceicoccales bacterium CK1056]|uniref:Oligosaccharide flippase family protein n=1 Tax=Oceanipulchritudo coccoides TaxID=2706888 RepID=A0A6B2M4M2_9BACT|nr:oligosaccharide flippase family protein [Oceanipulchritudo coccoides]NDV63044.1 oligosaccharide flippase family protein [Oceanipulchritudo coccoides]